METSDDGETRGYVRYRSDGLPSHEHQAEYAVPRPGGPMVPSPATAVAIADPTRAQNYDFLIPTDPVQAATPTPTNLGTIGVTVATSSNFTVLNARGESVAFLDASNGHPTPMMGMYHYQALPSCVTAMVDVDGGPSHIIGVAFDGYPIYGDRDIDGARVVPADLDDCGGITSPTPEFPGGIYHYVLLEMTDATSSIRCFTGEVSVGSETGMRRPPPGG